MGNSTDLVAVLRRPVLEVAPRLLGSVLRHGDVSVRLTEVEAYDGANDPGSHAFRGRTPRNEVMFDRPGRLYVYFTYGMHHCCNVVTGTEGTASAVLLRAGEVLTGIDVARELRGEVAERDLARGPARLCQALGIDRSKNGAELTGEGLSLTLGDRLPASRISSGPRVGLREAADRPWRFWITGDRHVSAYRPAVARRRPPGR